MTRAVPRRAAVPFSTLYQRLHSAIVRSAYNQHVPGMTHDEIVAEMLVCLWQARRTYRRSLNVTFDQYWWAVWMHRKSDLYSYWLSKKRDIRRTVLVEADEQLEHGETCDCPIPPAPSSDPIAQAVWELLARGYTRKDILEKLAITKRHYYEVIESWRNPQIRSSLTGITPLTEEAQEAHPPYG